MHFLTFVKGKAKWRLYLCNSFIKEQSFVPMTPLYFNSVSHFPLKRNKPFPLWNSLFIPLNNSFPLWSNSSPLWSNSFPLRSNSSPLRNNSFPLRSNCFLLKNNSFPLRSNSFIPLNNLFPLRNKKSFIRGISPIINKLTQLSTI